MADSKTEVHAIDLSQMEGSCVAKTPRPSPTKQVQQCCTTSNAKRALKGWFPISEWLPKYSVRENASGDLVAGLTVGVMLVPQGMAYALLAGLPPAYGLYASILPILVYAFTGTSRQLAVGPVAMVSLLVYEALHSMDPTGTMTDADKVQVALVISFLVGMINIIFSLFRLGVVANFLSHSVLVGFTAGAAVIIGLSQLKHVLGYSLGNSPYPLSKIYFAFANIHNTNVATLVMSIVAIAILLILRTIKRRIIATEAHERETEKAHPVPMTSKLRTFRVSRSIVKLIANVSALVVVVIGTAVTAAVDKQIGDYTIPVVGAVEPGYPAPQVPQLSKYAYAIPTLLVPALVITILGFMESFAVAGNYAKKNGYEVSPNQELFALGMSNFVGSFFNAYPVTGGFSRTAVNADSGAKTPAASILSALVVLMSVYLLTDTFEYLPKAVLASIIFVAVSGLFNFSAAKFAWKVDKKDFTVMMITFLGTIGLGIELGLLIGFGASLVVILQAFAYPHHAVLGRLEDDKGEVLYRNVKRYPEAETNPQYAIVRVDAPIWFANSKHIQELLLKKCTRSSATNPGAKGEPMDATVGQDQQMDTTQRMDTTMVQDQQADTTMVQDQQADTTMGHGQQSNTHEQGQQLVKYLILDCSANDSVDMTAMEMIHELQRALNNQGVGLVLAAVKGPVRDKVHGFNAYELKHDPGSELLVPWLNDATKSEIFIREPMNCMTRTVLQAEHAVQEKLGSPGVVEQV